MLVGHYIATFSRLRRKHSAAVRASDARGFTRSSRQLVYAAIARGAGNQLTFGLRSVKVDEWRAVDGLQGFQRACTLARNFQVVGAIPRHESRQELPDGCFVGMTRPAVEWKTPVHLAYCPGMDRARGKPVWVQRTHSQDRGGFPMERVRQYAIARTLPAHPNLIRPLGVFTTANVVPAFVYALAGRDAGVWLRPHQ